MERNAVRTRKSPWHPNLIFWITFCLSPVIGGVFHTLNFRRLGSPGQARVEGWKNSALALLFLALVLTPVVPAHLVWLIALAVAGYFRASQLPLYREHAKAGGDTASWRRPALVAVLAVPLLLLGIWGLEYLVRGYQFGRFTDLYERGRYVEAQSMMEWQIEYYPDDPMPYWNLASVHAELGNHEGVHDRLHDYLALAPDDLEARQWLEEVEQWLAEQAGVKSGGQR